MKMHLSRGLAAAINHAVKRKSAALSGGARCVRKERMTRHDVVIVNATTWLSGESWLNFVRLVN